jgi:hypothetical protein
VENLAAERAKQYLTIIECDIFDPAAIAKGTVQIIRLSQKQNSIF